MNAAAGEADYRAGRKFSLDIAPPPRPFPA